MKTILKILVIGFCLMSLAGCASMFGNKNRVVNVSSNPNHAKVYYNGNYVGKTPTHITIGNPTDTNMVRITKPGYEPQQKPVKTSFQPVGVLNILFWPGFIVDYATGDMKKVSPNLAFAMERSR